eukprot:CAMPEP_0183330758 /NCGR_PEP_ID=MMETSP0164_2-20130417/167_1 /TAXON_ID=221442 /ORGANISM="Coccolithus pelagicus ssp braarudi, Strain PLY182g" /LENGTH=45 /DNA_ID= /DNA_START= /DNA_END= /DNA_ORIENTATION=
MTMSAIAESGKRRSSPNTHGGGGPLELSSSASSRSHLVCSSSQYE